VCPVSTVLDLALRAREASYQLAIATTATKDHTLQLMASALENDVSGILHANQQDLQRAQDQDTPEHLLDRLRLTKERILAMAKGLRDLASLPDPVGEIIRGSVLANGLEMRQVRVPFGVVGMIYEARPNVTVDAAGICLKSGNAALLRGSSSAQASNKKLVLVLREALTEAGLPADAIQMVPADDRETVKELMRARGLVDLLIPRGGAGLIRSVVEESTVPVIETGVGNCHVYVDAGADLAKALPIVMNSKTHRPSVCNSAESLLVHKSQADEFLPQVVAHLQSAGVVIHGDHHFAQYDDVQPATDRDYSTEYLSLEISARVVDSLEDAIAHIRAHSSLHTEAIVTEDLAAARKFVAEVDAAAVLVNASTRFTDGGEFGFGAEIGISTQKLHARGPMGLQEMTSNKYVVYGTGQVR
jgi:glutamate-5-semialdehyde dehydrogenase